MATWQDMVKNADKIAEACGVISCVLGTLPNMDQDVWREFAIGSLEEPHMVLDAAIHVFRDPKKNDNFISGILVGMAVMGMGLSPDPSVREKAKAFAKFMEFKKTEDGGCVQPEDH